MEITHSSGKVIILNSATGQIGHYYCGYPFTAMIPISAKSFISSDIVIQSIFDRCKRKAAVDLQGLSRLVTTIIYKILCILIKRPQNCPKKRKFHIFFPGKERRKKKIKVRCVAENPKEITRYCRGQFILSSNFCQQSENECHGKRNRLLKE